MISIYKKGCHRTEITKAREKKKFGFGEMAMTPRTGTAYPIRPRPVVAGAVRPVYEDFRPVTERKEDEESNNLLLIYLPGF